MARRKSCQHGSVQEHNGQWTVVYREFDHAKRKWVQKREGLGKLKNKKAALKAAEPILARVNERNNDTGWHCINAPLTFKEFIDKRWRAYAASAKHKRSTMDTYDTLLKNQLIPVFGEKTMTEITSSDISDFLDAKRGALANNTIHVLYGMLRLIFEIARQYDLIEQSSVRSLVHKPESEKTEKATLTPPQIRALLTALCEQERLYLLLLAVTGMRMNEGLALRWMDMVNR